jgi:beta-galactosidase
MTFYYGSDYYPEQWPESRWVEDARLMQEAGFNVVRIGEFAWAKMEPNEGRYAWGWLDRAIDTLASHGLQIVLGTPTAAPPPWLTTAYPEILPRDRHRRVRHAGSRHHYCANSPIYREHTSRIVTTLAERYGGDDRIIGWQTDNEFGGHGIGRCYCDICATRFQEWLQRRYSSLETLNQAWGSVFWSAVYGDWREIPLPWATPTYHNPSHVLDFYRFGSDSVCEYQQLQIDILRTLAPDQFITHNLMPFGSRELDFYDLADSLDFVSWDNYHFHGATPTIVAATHDRTWGFKRSGYWVMEQQVSNVNWTPYNPTFRPDEVGLKVWQSIARGADGVIYFRWRAARLGAELYHSGLLDHGGRPTRGYEEAKALGQALVMVRPLLEGSSPSAEIAVLHDYPSRWSLDLQPHNCDLANDESFRRAFMGPYEALWERNVPVHVLAARGEHDLSTYKVVIVPAMNLVSREYAARLRAYVQNGGTLVATARTAFKDESGQVSGPAPGHLADLLGVKVEEIDSQPADHGNRIEFVGRAVGTVPVRHWFEVLQPTTAQPLAVYKSDYYAGRPAATLREVGGGQAIYVGVLAEADFYRVLFDWLLPPVNVQPLLNTPPGVEASARTGPTGQLLFLINHNDAPATIRLHREYVDVLAGEHASQQVRVEPRGVIILNRDPE